MAYAEPPFRGQTPFELSTKIMTAQRLAPPLEIPRGLNAVIEGCTEKDPALRYQSAGEVAEALEELDRALTAWCPEPRERRSTRVRRILFRGALAAALLFGLVFGIPSARNLMSRHDTVTAPTPAPTHRRASHPKAPAAAPRSKSTRKPVAAPNQPGSRPYYEELLARAKGTMQALVGVARKLLGGT
jgi:serine/threonine protein kinase